MRLGKFLRFLEMQGTLEDKSRYFADKGKHDSIWAFNSLPEFLQTQKKRLMEKNNCRDNSQLCEKCQIILSDGRFSYSMARGLPRARRYADDRAD